MIWLTWRQFRAQAITAAAALAAFAIVLAAAEPSLSGVYHSSGFASCHGELPKVKDVVAGLAINPNTVLKAYRELEYEGLVAARPGIGTFVTGTLDGGSLAAHQPLRRDLQRWLAKARRAGLDDESIEALFASTFRSASEDVAGTGRWAG